jgi:1-acyl-sn-glycerol-3-phosphate acyltransferase
MYEIMRLSGQEYVDLYASKAKELASKAKKDVAELPLAEPGPAGEQKQAS